MSWALVGAAAVTTGGSLLATQLGGGKKGSLPALPPFESDEYVGKAEEGLWNFGSNALNGVLPTAYQNLLQFDSPQFESVLHNSNRDVEQAGLETAARTGNINSGASAAGINKAIADNSSNLRYGDYMSTIANQKGILSLGLNAEQAAGQIGLSNQGQRNSYTLGGYSAMLGAIPRMTQLSQEGQSATGTAIGAAFGSVASSLPYLFGGVSAGSTGAGQTGNILGSLGAENATPGGMNIDEILRQLSQHG